MIPMYGYMDSHPFRKNQTPFTYQYPNMETIPSYMMMDPTKSCIPPHDPARNCWHYGYPMPSYSCCNGGNLLPGYYNFRPPHQQTHCHGAYPPCLEPYYVQYAPPTHYNVEQPRYEFDKNMMRNHHCCGCPNSLCGRNQKEDQCVKIEEKPDYQRKGSLVPFQNNQSPIVWIPPDYIGSEKEREPSETRTVEQEKEHRGSNLKPVEQASKFWNGWPLSDLSRLRSWLPDADGMGTQSVQNKQQEEGKKEFPFPFIWMPAFGKYAEEPSNLGKSVPTNILQKDDAINEGPEVVKTINQNNIPEVDMNRKTEDTEKTKERRCIPVETVKENQEKELSRDNVKGRSSSSPKKSRLPPVCLRVEPLPKKKNGNGSPRSRSPSKSTAVKESSRSDSEIDNIAVEPGSEKIIKAVEVKSHGSSDGNQGEEVEDNSRTGEPLSLPTPSQEKVLDQLCKEETEESTTEMHGGKDKTISQVPEDLVQEERKNEKPNLSDVEAAMLIQSAFRGYEVRKWELLKKMKQLAEVRQQVIEVQNRVNALELAAQDEKEKVFVGELIMRLLLKLDTIQGLHPTVREFRKSLAKELVTLQERLDRMVINKPTEVVVVKEASTEEPVENFDVETHDDIKEEQQYKDDVVEIGEIFPEGANESNGLLEESHSAQPLPETDDTAGFEGLKSASHKELQNEDNCELSSENFTNWIEDEKDMSMLMGDSRKPEEAASGDKKPEEAESGDEMEHNVEEMNTIEKNIGEVLQTDVKEETLDCQAYSLEDRQHLTGDSLEVYVSNSTSDDQVRAQAGQTPGILDKITISAADENGEAEDQLVADMELPTRGDDSPNNIEADKSEHIEMGGQESEAEKNAHDLEVELNGGRTPNEKQPEGQEECHASSVASDQNEVCLSSSTKCKNENEKASDESAELLGENDDLNIENELEIERNEQLISDEGEKVLEDVQYQTLPSSELDDQARRAYDESAELLEQLPSYNDANIQNKMVTEKNEHTAGEDVQQESCILDDASQGTMDKHEKEINKKLVEENEKMREMVEKLMEAGKEQISIISKLSGRVKDLEKKLVRKKKLRRGCGMSLSKRPALNGVA